MVEPDDIRSRPAARPVPKPEVSTTDASDPKLINTVTEEIREDSPAGGSADPPKAGFKLGCFTWGLIVVLVVTVLSFIPSWQQAAEDRRAEEAAAVERARQDAFFDSAMSQCGVALSAWKGGSVDDYVELSASANGGVITVKGRNVADWVCQYSYSSFDDRELDLIQLTWNSPSGEVVEVLRTGQDGQLIAEVTEISPECANAFQAAAAIPLGRDNNTEVYQTGSACQSVEEWWLAVKKFPKAFGSNMYPDEDLWIYLVTLCGGAEGAPVCRDAEAKGIFD